LSQLWAPRKELTGVSKSWYLLSRILPRNINVDLASALLLGGLSFRNMIWNWNLQFC
jgi:hypothetical protein